MSKVYCLLKNGFEEVEALTVVDYLRRADIDIDLVSVEDGLEIEGAHGIKVLADISFDKIDEEKLDMVFIPGGMPGASSLRDDDRVIDLIKRSDDRGRIIAAICAGPIVLEKAGVLKGKKVTSYPGFEKELSSIGKYCEDRVVVDENIVSSRGPALAVVFALELIELIKGKEKRDDIAGDILFDQL